MAKSVSITMAAAMLAVVIGLSGPASAAPTVKVNTKYYGITGRSAAALRQQMRTKSPNGYWAYTRWRVKWSSDCRVQVTLNYTFPKLKNPNTVPLHLRKKFQSMLVNLKAHEQGHGQNGRDAGREIQAANCVNAQKIIKKYSTKDKTYDAETRHGYLGGVRLEN